MGTVLALKDPTHTITAAPAKTMSRGTWWRSTCSCGGYRSGLHPSDAHALAAGAPHMLAKSA